MHLFAEKAERKRMRVTKYGTRMDERKRPVLVKEKAVNYPEAVNTPAKICQMINEMFQLSSMTDEYAYMIAVDPKCHIKGVFEISHGTQSMTLLSSQTIFRNALLVGASSIFIVHNHPSGDVTPSEMDKKSTEKIKKAGELLEVQLLDHLIIGAEGRYFSFHDHGLLGR